MLESECPERRSGGRYAGLQLIARRLHGRPQTPKHPRSPRLGLLRPQSKRSAAPQAKNYPPDRRQNRPPSPSRRCDRGLSGADAAATQKKTGWASCFCAPHVHIVAMRQVCCRECPCGCFLPRLGPLAATSAASLFPSFPLSGRRAENELLTDDVSCDRSLRWRRASCRRDALLGRFLPRLGPLVATPAASFLF
jgi:hypothetical protein